MILIKFFLAPLDSGPLVIDESILPMARPEESQENGLGRMGTSTDQETHGTMPKFS